MSEMPPTRLDADENPIWEIEPSDPSKILNSTHSAEERQVVDDSYYDEHGLPLTLDEARVNMADKANFDPAYHTATDALRDEASKRRSPSDDALLESALERKNMTEPVPTVDTHPVPLAPNTASQPNDNFTRELYEAFHIVANDRTGQPRPNMVTKDGKVLNPTYPGQEVIDAQASRLAALARENPAAFRRVAEELGVMLGARAAVGGPVYDKREALVTKRNAALAESANIGDSMRRGDPTIYRSNNAPGKILGKVLLFGMRMKGRNEITVTGAPGENQVKGRDLLGAIPVVARNPDERDRRVWTTPRTARIRAIATANKIHEDRGLRQAQADIAARKAAARHEATEAELEEERDRNRAYEKLMQAIPDFNYENDPDRMAALYGEVDVYRDNLNDSLNDWFESGNADDESDVLQDLSLASRYIRHIDDSMNGLSPHNPWYAELSLRRAELMEIYVAGRYRAETLRILNAPLDADLKRDFGDRTPVVMLEDKGILLPNITSTSSSVVVYPDGTTASYTPARGTHDRAHPDSTLWVDTPPPPLPTVNIDPALPMSELRSQYHDAQLEWFENPADPVATWRAERYAQELNNRLYAEYAANPANTAALEEANRRSHTAAFLHEIPGNTTMTRQVIVTTAGNTKVNSNHYGTTGWWEIASNGAMALEVIQPDGSWKVVERRDPVGNVI